MTIINRSKELSPKETYLLTKAVNSHKMKASVGEAIHVSAWVVYEDTDKKDPTKTNTVLAITDGTEVYATNSATFLESFMGIVEIFGNEGYTVTVDLGTSKAGREFIQCIYID